MGWLKDQWLKAQGVPWWYMRQWKANTFEVYPPHCVVCGRAWRPDKRPYIALFGRTRRPELGSEFFVEWYSPALGITSTTGLAPDQDQIRHICTEHADRWVRVMDCVTGEEVGMSFPLSPAQRAMRDVVYWGGSAIRLVFLLVQWAWLYAEYKLTKRARLYIRSPWPPVREETCHKEPS